MGGRNSIRSELTKRECLIWYKIDHVRLNPKSICFIIVDGADQCAFGFPRLTTYTKIRRFRSLKVKLLGVSEHAVQNNLFLFATTQERKTGAKHIVKPINRFINIGVWIISLLQNSLSNWTIAREETKKCIQWLTLSTFATRVFDYVEVSFLPVEMTHEDINQCLSQTSGRLNKMKQLRYIIYILNFPM